MRRIRRLFHRRSRDRAVQLSPLEQFQNASKSAVFMIHNTISELKGINEAIEREEEAGRQKIREIEETNSCMAAQREGNSRIIAKFENLLE